MRKFIAIVAAEFARALVTLTKKGSGSALPGVFAQAVDPKIIGKLSKMIKGGVIIVTGTNGKTTTAKMIASILETAGHRVIYNFSGSNLSRGIASFLIKKTNFLGTRIDGDIGIFEVDEATMPEILSMVQPKYIVVTNLFRDQLDRYGEVDKTAALIGKALAMAKDATILLNGDDPLVASLSLYNGKVQYFGIDDKYQTLSKGAIDSRNCTSCGHELTFSPRYFGHLGNFKCPNCGLGRPNLNYSLTNMSFSVESSRATFVAPNMNTEISISLPGLYNLYNALAASSIAADYGIPETTIITALLKLSAAFGRMEKIKIGEKNIYLMLVKNPTGFTQTIETLTFDNNKKNILIALNDNFADGTDVSWIWDAEVEIIKEYFSNFTVSGIRADDMLLRLKYADFDTTKITKELNLKTAMESALKKVNDGETLYVLPTYTAMLEIRRDLANQGLVKGFLE